MPVAVSQSLVRDAFTNLWEQFIAVQSACIQAQTFTSGMQLYLTQARRHPAARP
jgi:hypothetical protein